MAKGLISSRPYWKYFYPSQRRYIPSEPNCTTFRSITDQIYQADVYILFTQCKGLKIANIVLTLLTIRQVLFVGKDEYDGITHLSVIDDSV